VVRWRRSPRRRMPPRRLQPPPEPTDGRAARFAFMGSYRPGRRSLYSLTSGRSRYDVPVGDTLLTTLQRRTESQLRDNCGSTLYALKIQHSIDVGVRMTRTLRTFLGTLCARRCGWDSAAHNQADTATAWRRSTAGNYEAGRVEDLRAVQRQDPQNMMFKLDCRRGARTRSKVISEAGQGRTRREVRHRSDYLTSRV